MQGSATMPDNNKAPVWFLKAFIKVRFVELATSKHVEIVTFNKKIEELVNKTQKPSNISNSCSKCNKQFSLNSIPTKCSFCHEYFHKSTCLPPHSSTCPARRSSHRAASVSMPTPSSSSQPSSMVNPNLANTVINAVSCSASPTPTRSSIVNASASSSRIVTTFVPAPSISFTATNSSKRPRSSTEESQISPQQEISLPHPPDLPPAPPPQVCPPTSTSPSSGSFVSVLNPAANPFNLETSAGAQNSRKRSKVNTLSPEKARIDFLNLELNTAKTRMTHLESIIQDRDDTIKIQKEKIRLLEENQHKSVNSNPPINNQNSTLHSSSCCSYSYHRCCPPQPSPCPHYQPHHNMDQRHKTHECWQEQQPSSHINHGTLLGNIKSSLGNIDDKITSLVDILLQKNCDKVNIQPNNEEALNTLEANADTGPAPDQINTVDVEINNSGESIASDDEFVPDVPSSNLHLNSNVMTIQ